ncbi:uncharacterized protein LOC113059668 isoform X2 [Carassius auratus]|uniref:Uncharacterized protein LOC113059668 isoform X2 n=1 Tax=Carassius auratus TaxID=7957 RepID=A0A6P6LHC5_CARAU|nr:uncharacterized protein LOC113059668 isoform X2 [Carassius auratus]
MTPTVSQGEVLMVFTATSNPKSRWPLLCHILSSLCYGPVCFASPEMEEKLTDTQRVIGSLQIVVAVMNLVLGLFGIIFFIVNNSPSSIVMPVLQLCVALSFCVLTIKSLFKKGGRAKLVENTTSESTIGKSKYSLPFGHSCGMTLALTQIIVGVMNITMGCFGFVFAFWIGGAFLVVGIVCVLAVTFPHPRLLVITVALNVVSAALAITAAVLYSMDLAMGSSVSCYKEYYYSSNNVRFAHKKSNLEPCVYYKNLSQMMLGRLDIMMIVLSVLQLCVTISFCVLTGKALCKNDEDAKSVEDPELHKLLLEDDTAGAA